MKNTSDSDPISPRLVHRLFARPAVAVGAASLLLVASCATRATLRPSDAARDSEVFPRAAVSTVDDVEVVAQADAWPGDPRVRNHVTPVRVTIRNESAKPVRVAYDALALVAGDGHRYAALPPYRIAGDIHEPVLAERYTAIDSPLFDYHGFRIAPYYRPVYPALAFADGPFYFDPYYYDHYHTVWLERDLPTPEMRRRALPEGVLDAGGDVTGFVYFEAVDPDDATVRFRADLVDAETGETFGEASIPFRVDASARAR